MLGLSAGNVPLCRWHNRSAKLAVSDRPGLGIAPDMEGIRQAHELYQRVAAGARDDAMPMRYLVPDWTYDPKRPSLVR